MMTKSHRRYLVMFGNELRYFENEDSAARGAMKGVMILIPSTAIAYKDKCVTITENGRAPAKLQFETREEAERWFKVLLDSKAGRCALGAGLALSRTVRPGLPPSDTSGVSRTGGFATLAQNGYWYWCEWRWRPAGGCSPPPVFENRDCNVPLIKIVGRRRSIYGPAPRRVFRLLQGEAGRPQRVGHV